MHHPMSPAEAGLQSLLPGGDAGCAHGCLRDRGTARVERAAPAYHHCRTVEGARNDTPTPATKTACLHGSAPPRRRWCSRPPADAATTQLRALPQPAAATLPPALAPAAAPAAAVAARP